MLLKDVFDSYMTVSGENRGAAYMDRLMFQAMDKAFGPKAVNEISPLDLSNYLKKMRDKRIKRDGVLRPLQPATLNKHTQFLRRLLTHADALGEPVQRFRWSSFHVMEAEQKTSYLTIPEEHIALVDMDDYIRPLFLFSVLSGVRQANALSLQWDQVDMDNRVITFQGKSRRPGGKTYIVPLRVGQPHRPRLHLPGQGQQPLGLQEGEAVPADEDSRPHVLGEAWPGQAMA